MRSLFLYNSILFLGLPFCDQKGSEKVSLLRGAAWRPERWPPASKAGPLVRYAQSPPQGLHALENPKDVVEQ